MWDTLNNTLRPGATSGTKDNPSYTTLSPDLPQLNYFLFRSLLKDQERNREREGEREREREAVNKRNESWWTLVLYIETKLA